MGGLKPTFGNETELMSRYHQTLILTFSFFVLLVLIAVFHDDGILRVFKMQDQMADMDRSNKILYADNLKIREEIKRLKSNPLAIEKIAREKLNWVKPGETVYQIVRKTTPPQKNP
jgi:cell division protein FtsB